MNNTNELKPVNFNDVLKNMRKQALVLVSIEDECPRCGDKVVVSDCPKTTILVNCNNCGTEITFEDNKMLDFQ